MCTDKLCRNCIKKVIASISISIMFPESWKSDLWAIELSSGCIHWGYFLLLMCVSEDRCSVLDDRHEMKAIPHKLKRMCVFHQFPFISINFIFFQQKTDENSDSFRMLVALLKGYNLGHCKWIRKTQESIYGKKGGATLQQLSYFVESEHTRSHIISWTEQCFLCYFLLENPTEH